MPHFVRFDEWNPASLESLDVNHSAVSSILLGPPPEATPRFSPTAPAWATEYLQRQYRACEISFKALKVGGLEVPHPVTGELTRCTHTFAKRLDTALSFVLFKLFGPIETGFCLAFSKVTSSVTHLVIPSRDCVIYDIDPATTEEIWQTSLACWNEHTCSSTDGPVIGVVEMVDNFAHQAMNHLSGIQRVLDSGVAQCVDEIWIAGSEFFGPTDSIFPELADKFQWKSKHDLPSLLNESSQRVFKLGSIVLPATLGQRLRALRPSWLGTEWRSDGSWPLIAFTCRSDGRRCVNLPSVIAEVVDKLLPSYPRLGVILDGWVFPESAITCCSTRLTAVLLSNRERLLQEYSVCSDICTRLPPGILKANLIGMSFLESIQALQHVDAYLSHVGTLEHKLNWFTSARGVVHGPTALLGGPITEAFSVEDRGAPLVIPPHHVRDVPTDTPRGASFFDYEIVDTSGIVEAMRAIIDAGPR